MIRSIFFLVVLVHVCFHLLGAAMYLNLVHARWFPFEADVSSSGNTSIIAGLLWLSASVTFVYALTRYLLHKKKWWVPGIVAVVISQSVIILYWNDAKFGTAVNIIFLVAVLLSYYRYKFDANVSKKVAALLSAQAPKDEQEVRVESIQHLPPIVQRWLLRSNVLGKAKTKTIHLFQKGSLRTKPNGKWLPMEAEQFITTENPGFVWQASIHAGSLFTINGCDTYRNGKGGMLIKALNMVTLAKNDGKEIDQGAMMRYLAEMMWYPDAALNNYVRWEYISDTKARALMRHGDVTAAGIFSFNENGDVIGFEGKRYADLKNVYSLETWSISVKGYQEFNGTRIANNCEVTWKLKDGDFTWLKIEVTSVNYNEHHVLDTRSAGSRAQHKNVQRTTKFILSNQHP